MFTYGLRCGATLLLVSAGLLGAEAAKEPSDEKAKTEFLISAVAQSDATLVVLGKRLRGEAATAVLHERLEKAGAEVRTARGFIEVCLRRSEGKEAACEVVLADGKTSLPAAAWFETVLAAHELTLKSLREVPVGPEQIREMIGMLGNEGFAERERATLALARWGKIVLPELEQEEKASEDAEVRARCAKIREAIENAEATALGVLAYIERSGATFLRPGKGFSSFTAQQFSAHLQTKAVLLRCSLTAKPAEFIEKIASMSSLHHASYRVRLADGTETTTREWLKEKFKGE